MKYEAPEVTALTPAISAIQGPMKLAQPNGEGPGVNYEAVTAAYEAWED